MRSVLLLATALAGLSPAAQAALFVPNSGFTVDGLNSPTTFTKGAVLTPGTTQQLSTDLTLTVSIVPDGTAEWLVFDYSSGGIPCTGVASGCTGGNGGGGEDPPLSQPGSAWHLNEVGLDAAVPTKFDGSFIGFTFNGAFQPATSSFFANFTPGSSPVPGDSSNVGFVAVPFSVDFPAGPLGPLGTNISPFDFLDVTGINSANVNGYEEALRFSPQQVVSAPESGALALFGVGLVGLGLTRRRGRS